MPLLGVYWIYIISHANTFAYIAMSNTHYIAFAVGKYIAQQTLQ